MTADPAVIDRRQVAMVSVQEGDLPIRSMSIAGIDGRADAKILSKDQSGPATRMVRLPAGWGTGTAGAFTGDVELFLVEGELAYGGETLGGYDYVAFRAGAMLGGLRAKTDVLGLLMTSEPIRYDTAAGGMLAEAQVVRSAGLPWEALDGLPGRLRRHLSAGLHGEIQIGGATNWVHEGSWHRHDGAEEMFVLEGTIEMTEWVDGEETRRVYPPGAYVHRGPSLWHAGPGSISTEVAITFHRLTEPGTQWTEQPDPA